MTSGQRGFLVSWAAEAVNLAAASREFEGKPTEFEHAGDVAIRIAAFRSPLVESPDAVLVFEGWLSVAERGPVLRGEAAAEALAARYRAHGTALARGLAGDFAFALWDRKRGTLVAGCDPLAGRSIAYTRVGGGWLLATRAIALLRAPDVSSMLDPIYATHALCDTWTAAPGTTPFAAIRRIAAGHVAELSASGEMIETRVDALRGRSHGERTDDDRVGRFWETLGDVVQSHVQSPDRRASVLLSGGLDSSVVTAALAMARLQLTAFTFRGPPSDDVDRTLVDEMLKAHPGLAAHPIHLGSPAPVDEHGAAFAERDDPAIMAGAFAPARRRVLLELRRRNLNMVFDGEGGDELFTVALRPADLLREREPMAFVRSAGSLRRLRSRIWRALFVPMLPRAIRRLWDARELRRLDVVPPWFRPSFARQPHVRAALQETSVWSDLSGYRHTLAFALQRAVQVGFRQTVASASEASSVHSISPLLDRRIVEFALGIPARARHGDGRPKAFLRSAARGRIPESIEHRAKVEPLYAWYERSSLGATSPARATEALRACPVTNEYVFVDDVSRRLREYAQGRGDPHRATSLYRLLEFAFWYEATTMRCAR